MLIDHIGFFLFPKIKILRYIGRLAFPMFAFFISEGAKYTKHKARYWGTVTLLGIIMFAIQYIVQEKIYGNVLLSFSMSIALIFLIQEIKRSLNISPKNIKKLIFLLIFLIFGAIFAYYATIILKIEYDFIGLLLPVIISLPDLSGLEVSEKLKKFDNLYVKLLFMLIPLAIMSVTNALSYQWYCIFSVLPLLLYNGKRGRLNLKYLFYIFYPLHIVILYGIKYFI